MQVKAVLMHVLHTEELIEVGDGLGSYRRQYPIPVTNLGRVEDL
jgi:hypothetical protein